MSNRKRWKPGGRPRLSDGAWPRRHEQKFKEKEGQPNRVSVGVFNGDVGVIFKVHKSDDKVTVFYDDKTVEYEGDELEQLALAYACTIHKSFKLS